MVGTRASRYGVVTVTYNSSETIGPFLKSVRQHLGKAVEVVVVDNASADAEQTRAISESYSARFVPAPSNLGYGSGMNLGVSHLSSNVATIVLSNPDLTFESNILLPISKLFDAQPKLGIAGPQIREDDGEIYPSARAFPSLRIGIGHALFSRIWLNNPWTRAYHSGAIDYTKTSYPGWLSGACLVVKKSTFTDISGFDSAFFMYFEDVDLCLRAAQAGWGRVFVPEAQVTHLGSHSTQGSSKRMLAEHHRSAYTYLSRKYDGWYLWPVRAVLWVGLKLRLTWELSRQER